MLSSINVFYRISISYKCAQNIRREFVEYYTAGVLPGGGQLPEFFARGGAAAPHPAGRQPPDKHAGGRAGVKLFKRTSKSVRLTQEGYLYTQYAGEIMRLFNVSRGRLKAAPVGAPAGAGHRLPQHAGAGAALRGARAAARGGRRLRADAARGAARLAGEPAAGRGDTGDAGLSGKTRPSARSITSSRSAAWSAPRRRAAAGAAGERERAGAGRQPADRRHAPQRRAARRHGRAEPAAGRARPGPGDILRELRSAERGDRRGLRRRR